MVEQKAWMPMPVDECSRFKPAFETPTAKISQTRIKKLITKNRSSIFLISWKTRHGVTPIFLIIKK